MPPNSHPIPADGRSAGVDISTTALHRRVARELSCAGYAVVKTPLPQDSFLALCRALGTPWRRTPIRLESWGSSARSSAALQSDNPYSNITAYHCSVPCPRETPLQIADLRWTVHALPEEDKALLHDILFEVPGWPGAKFAARPLLDIHRGNRIHYRRWGAKGPPSLEHQAAFSRFKEAVDRVWELNPILIPLALEQSLFIDNTKLLHARGKVPASSPRDLLRIWIDTEEVEFLKGSGFSNFDVKSSPCREKI